MSEIHTNRDTFCVHCKIPFPKRMTIADGRGGQMAKGMIMLCSACGGAQILGDSEWRPMTKQDFEALPPLSKEKLVATANALKARLKAGVEWSPYEQTRKN